MKYFLFFLFSNLILSSFTFAAKAERCFQGNKDERTVIATQTLESIIDVSPLPNSNSILKKLPLKNGNQINITTRLAAVANQLGCEFSVSGQFITLGETLNSMVYSFFKKSEVNSNNPEIKPGFKMALIPTDGPNFIYLEVTEDGFVFHDCGKDDKDYTRSKVYPGSFCRTLLSEGVFLPVNQVLHGLSSGKHVAKVFLKALSETTVVITSSLGLGLVSPIASGVSSYLEQDSMARIKRDFAVHKMINEMLKLEAYSQENGDQLTDNILTRVVPYTYEDLRGALVDVFTVMLADDFKQLKLLDHSPGNPSLMNLPGLKIQQSVNRVYNQLYQQGKTTVPTETEME